MKLSPLFRGKSSRGSYVHTLIEAMAAYRESFSNLNHTNHFNMWRKTDPLLSVNWPAVNFQEEIRRSFRID